LAYLAIDGDLAAMQLYAALYDDQTKTGAWPVIDVVAPLESVKEPLSVGFWDSNALITDRANHFRVDAPDFEPHRPPGVRILHRVRQQIRENVS
jgi:hypothetical protein